VRSLAGARALRARGLNEVYSLVGGAKAFAQLGRQAAE
jgi:rhodanese-related sulfurtransferase